MTVSHMLRLNLLRVVRFALLGLVVGGLLGYVNFLIVDAQPGANILWGLLAGFMIGVTVGTMEVFVFFGRMRNSSFRLLLALRLFVYIATLSVWLTAANASRLAEARDTTMLEAARFYVLEGPFRRDFLLVSVASLLFIWVLQASQLQRSRDVFNFILGRYHTPQESEMVFLFVDLTASTSIAEDLGHLRYSAFLQDFFFDLNTAVLPWRGTVYQYVGDQVIIVWPWKVATDQARCVECFFAMQDAVEANRQRYIESYGICPEFKGGLHGGIAVVTWVGEIKKEIVYHGDVLNTAARIQGHAKGSPYPCVASGDLLAGLTLPEGFGSTEVGEVTLRGKDRELDLHGLERA